MASATQFLSNVRSCLKSQDGLGLAQCLRVEPPLPNAYFQMGQELRTGFRGDSKVLEQLINKTIPEEDDVPEGQGTAWPSFTAFMAEYLGYWRDVNFDDLISTHSKLSSLLGSCASALTHPAYGAVMLHTSINLSQTLAKLTRSLQTRPDLVAQMDARRGAVEEEDEKSVMEVTAEIITKIFTTCLNDRSSTRFERPKGKKIAVYQLANLVLKLLFLSKKTRPANQLFTQLATLSPPLSHYPASQRVTYLYYLGRFLFTHNQFVRAAACLESAYLQTPSAFTSHRTQILTYLLPSQLLIGRLPTQNLLSRPEAATLASLYASLSQSIRLGSFLLLASTLRQHESVLFASGILISLQARIRPLIWRSLARRTFVLTWTPAAGPGAMEADGPRRAATLDLNDLVAAATYQQKILEGYTFVPGTKGAMHKALGGGGMHSLRASGANPVFLRAVSNSAVSEELTGTSTLVPPAGGKGRRLRPLEGVLSGNVKVDVDAVEMIVAGLAQMGWVKGYVAHAQGKLAISGVKAKGGNAIRAGWPGVWEIIAEREGVQRVEEVEVPGWVRG